MTGASLSQLKDEKYVSLASFRRDGRRVETPVWFAEREGRLYVMTPPDSGKVKRIRRDPQVEVAPCTAGGRVTGKYMPARARFLPSEQAAEAKLWIGQRYWLARVPLLWRRSTTVLEISPR